MTVTDAIEGAIEVTKGLNEIKSSNLAFAKEALQITAQAGEAITPFIPLIGLAATAIVEIINIYQTSQYNKRICNSLLDRARLSEIAIDQLIRRRKENEKNFKSQVWYHAFNRFVVILGKIKTFAEKVSQLQGFKVYFKARSVSEKFNLLMDDYDNAMKDLNFTMAIANDQQRQIDSESLKADLSEMNEFLEKIGDNIEENSIKMSLIYEEVQNIKSMISKSEINETKRIDSNKLTEPVVGRQSDTRGFRGRTKRRIYMNAIEVACRAINIPEEDSPDYKITQPWNQDPNIRISITKLLIQLDDLSKKYVKPGCSPGLEPQEIANFDIPSNSLNDKSDEIPDDVDFSNIDVDFEPLIPISEGVKAYKEKNHEKAWKCFNEQAENQNSLGKYWKAFYLWGGLFNQKDKLAALALYKEAADDGITDAQYRYALSLLDKDIKSKIQTNSKEEAVKYLRIAAENGSGSAQFQIGEGYYNGNLGYAQNLEMAKLWYKRAALKDDKKAKERLKALGVNN
ncbi:hypothetical protein RhiirA4_444481 [Rhizophagus irregularis]|uniref:HCP-like protein n=1 Tax=Rhizophagus irregularis TaxID=588596 RepID=A0A2I1GJD8_9GLOM|nr:hypothetical protein RhiirA4_444481 [Rhizophagus irregularis]